LQPVNIDKVIKDMAIGRGGSVNLFVESRKPKEPFQRGSNFDFLVEKDPHAEISADDRIAG